MMQRPWDRAQPDEWLPRNLRLCWGGDGDGGGGGFGGDSGGGGWGDGGYGGATTGGGDWGSAGSTGDFSGMDAGGIGAWGGTAYDASTAGTGMGGGGDWGSFAATNYSGFDAPNPTFTDIAGPNPGVTTGGGDWGSAGAASFSGTGGGPGGAMVGVDSYGGSGFGGNTGGGLFGGSGWTTGDYSGGGTFTGGSGGGYTGGGGGGKGGSSGGGAFSGTGRGSVTDSTPGYVTSVSGGKDVTPSEVSSPYADDTGPTGRGETEGPENAPAAAPEAEAEAEPASFGTPQAESEQAAPSQAEADPGPSLTDAAPAGMIGGSQDAAPTSAGGTTSAFGPQSLSYDYSGSPYADMGDQPSSSPAYNEGMQALSALTQSALAPDQSYDYSGSPYADMGPQAEIAAPDFNQTFESFAAQPGWDPAEQTAGRAGLAEPTDWAANPYAPSTDVSVGRDFDQAFEPFADTPTGMDLAGDLRSENEAPALTFDEMWGATPYSTLPSDQLSRSAQETLEHDFGYFPNPGYVQGPPEQSFNSWLNDAVNAALNPVGRALDYLPSLPNPTLDITNPATAWSNFAQNTLLGGQNTQSLNPDAIAAFEVGQQGRAGANPDTTNYAALFEGAAPTEAQPAVETSIPGGRETNFEYNVAPSPAPINVDIVRSDDPSVPADPRGTPQDQPGTLPPAVETPPEAPQQQPQEAPPQAPPQAPPVQPQEAPPQAPPPTSQVPPSLIEQAQTPPSQAPPTAPPGLVTMLPPGTPAPPVQPTETPSTPPGQQPAEPGEHDDAPEPQDSSVPPGDPNAPRPPGNIPGQLRGANGTYQNQRADNPQTNRNYRDSGRTDYPQGRPGIDFRTARQAGIVPRFQVEDINVEDVDARLVDAVNRALDDMPANIRGTLRATSAYRPAHRGEAFEHMMDPRTSQESVYSRGHPSSGGGGFASARPGGSNHGHGRALDFASSPALTWLRANAGRYGLETIANDHPHIQLRGARGNVSARPSAQEQAEQRAIDGQNRQAAIDRGLIAPGRGQAPTQQAGVPMPRGRPADAPQPEVAQPRPPADIPPPAALPPQPPAPRPPADIPAPALVPPARGRADPALLGRTATQIARDMAAKGPRPTSLAEGTAAAVGLARALAQAGIPANIATQIVTNVVKEGTRQAGYDPDGMLAGSTVKGIIATALQGYQPARPGEVQGPPAPEASLRGLAKGGRVAKDEPVVVGEEGPEFFVPDRPGTVVPHMPQPASRPAGDIDRWPKLPAVNYPGQYGGVEREMMRQTRSAQDPVPSLMDMIDREQLRLNAANWHRMINDPSLIALGRSRIEDRRFERDPRY